MATANFWSMADFDLWAVSDEAFESHFCKDCGSWNKRDAECCSECGGELESRYDEWEAFDYSIELENACTAASDRLRFFKIEPKSGYYSGMQLYVEELHDPNEYDNSDTQYYFDMCRSKAIRAYEAEKRKVARELKRIGEEHGMQRLAVVARFSNGEVWYQVA